MAQFRELLIGDGDVGGMVDRRAVGRGGQGEAVERACGRLGGRVGLDQQALGRDVAEIVQAAGVPRLEQLDVERVIGAEVGIISAGPA